MPWTAPEIAEEMRPRPGPTGDERVLADAWLDFHRQTLLQKCGGLTAEQLKLRSIERSELTLLGLVRHMAEVERHWFRARFAGTQPGYLYCSDDDLNAEFDIGAADAEADFATYAREIEAVREATNGHSLDETFIDPLQQLRNVIVTMRLQARHAPPAPSPSPQKLSHLVFFRTRGAMEAAVTAGKADDF